MAGHMDQWFRDELRIHLAHAQIQVQLGADPGDIQDRKGPKGEFIGHPIGKERQRHKRHHKGHFVVGDCAPSANESLPFGDAGAQRIAVWPRNHARQKRQLNPAPDRQSREKRTIDTK